MVRFFQMAMLSSFFFLTGCKAEKNTLLLQNIKVGDLAPSRNAKDLEGQSIKTANFEVYIFEVPDNNVAVMNNVWQIMYTKPFKFNDGDAFRANLFLVGFGHSRMWDKVADSLRAAGSKEVKKVSMLLSSGLAEDIPIITLSRQTVFYISAGGSIEGVTVGPGAIVLRIRAEKIAASRGVCSLYVQPVFAVSPQKAFPEFEAIEKTREFPFTPAGFGVKISPDDFIFLGTEKYSTQQTTLGSLFFSGAVPKPVVRMFLFVCTAVNY